jgi:hypothetical protein
MAGLSKGSVPLENNCFTAEIPWAARKSMLVESVQVIAAFFKSAVPFSLKQEAPASIRRGYVHFLQYYYVTESDAVLQGISLMFPK